MIMEGPATDLARESTRKRQRRKKQEEQEEFESKKKADTKVKI